MIQRFTILKEITIQKMYRIVIFSLLDPTIYDLKKIKDTKNVSYRSLSLRDQMIHDLKKITIQKMYRIVLCLSVIQRFTI